MKEKFWLLKINNSAKRISFYDNEKDLTAELVRLSNKSILSEVKLFSYVFDGDVDPISYLKNKDRQYKIKHAIDDVSELEIDIANLINYFKDNNLTSKRIYSQMVSLRELPIDFKNFITQSKMRVFSICGDENYMYLILKIHNFRNLPPYYRNDINYKKAFRNAKKRMK